MNDIKTRMFKNMRATVILSILALALSFAGMINAMNSRQQQMDKLARDGEKCYIDVQLLYGPFDGGEKDNYYIAVDSKLNFYAVRLGSSEIKKCEAIFEYVESGGAGSIPETVRIAGVVRDFDDETRAGAIQEFNKLLGRPVTNEGNIAVYLGAVYLDAASYIEIAWYMNFIPSVICVIFAGIFLSRHYKYIRLPEAGDVSKDEKIEPKEGGVGFRDNS